MTWELQTHRQPYVLPTIIAYLETFDNDADRDEWVAQRLAEHVDDADDEESFASAVNEKRAFVTLLGWYDAAAILTEHAINLATTSNGAHCVYISEYELLPWCSEAYAEDFWGQ